MPDEAAFKKALAERNMTVERLRADIRKDLAINKMMEAELASAPAVTDADVKDFYDKNPDEFTGVRASHILIKPDGFDEAAKKKARTAIDDVLKQAKAGTDFGELAKKHSSDGSAQQGGDLGFFTKGRWCRSSRTPPSSSSPARSATSSKRSSATTSSRSPSGRTCRSTEASEKIRDFLATKKRDDQQQAFVASIKNKSKIEVLF